MPRPEGSPGAPRFSRGLPQNPRTLPGFPEGYHSFLARSTVSASAARAFRQFLLLGLGEAVSMQQKPQINTH
jgi:hypothetical protein